jgi:L-threonylcarbamoyladenylate synthase
MEFISNCTADAISNAAKTLKDGHLVAFPTETVYGLGADATNEKAVSRIYSVKGRPTDHPLIVHISSINKLEDWATDIPDYAIKLAREFWPGPMTLILPRTDLAKDYITGRQDNVGLRVPDQPIALALLKKFEEIGGQGVAAPSANRFGAISPTLAEAVTEELSDYLEKNDQILDGGQCQVGLESTIIDCTRYEPMILRPGAIIEENIQSALGIKISKKKKSMIIRTSGMLDSHYAPKAEVSLNRNPNPGDGLIALSNIPTPFGVIRLGSPENTDEFARFIYIFLRLGDKIKLRNISVILPVDGALSEAISDRLSKASYR